MEIFSIRDIENLTGIKAHSWRTWEQRYPAFLPMRKGSSHRIYYKNDLRQMLHIAFLYQNGWKISKIAQLDAHQVIEEMYKIDLNESNYRTWIIKLIEAAIDFYEKEFDLLLEQLIIKFGFDQCITEICDPFLKRIGLLWAMAGVPPAQEHFSILMIHNKVIAETEKINKPARPPELLLFSPQDSSNTLPLLYLNYLLRRNGWSVVFLGSNTKPDILQQFTGNPHIQYLFIYQSTHPAHFDADNYLEDLCRTFGDKRIIAAGTLVRSAQRTFTNLTMLRSDKEIQEFIVQGSR